MKHQSINNTDEIIIWIWFTLVYYGLCTKYYSQLCYWIIWGHWPIAIEHYYTYDSLNNEVIHMLNREVCAQYIQSSWQGSCHMWTIVVVIVWQLDNYICNQCMSPLTLWVRILLRWGILYTSYVITFVIHWRHVGSFLRILRFHPPIKLVSRKYLYTLVDRRGSFSVDVFVV
jgi:hypothetical protein